MSARHSNERLLSRIEDLQLLVMMAKSSSGAGAAPLSRTAFIDGGTVQTSHTGSIGFPFGTISTWLTSISAGISAADSQAVRIGLLSPSLAGYTENLTFPAYKSVELRCVGFPQAITGNIVWPNVAGGGAVAPTSTAMLNLHNIGITGNLTVTDDVVASFILLSQDEGSFTSIVGNLDCSTCVAVQLISLFDTTIGGNLVSTANATGADLQLNGAAVTGNVTAKSVVALNSTIGGSVTVATGVGGDSTFTNCEMVGPITGGAGTTLVFDGPTWLKFIEAGGTIAGGPTVLVIGGYNGGSVQGANLTNADVTVSLDGTAASPGFTAGGNHYTLPAATLGAGHVLTLNPGGSLEGDTILITRQDATANTYTIKDDLGNTLAVLPVSQRGFFLGRRTGAHFVMAAVGSGA